MKRLTKLSPNSPFQRVLGVWRCLVILSLTSLSAVADWAPVNYGMMTKWGRELKPNNAWQEYPRPQMKRGDWTNLNGLWDYAVSLKEESSPSAWEGKILVPFCPESALSGVGRLILPAEALWYKRALPRPKDGKRTILTFEAVDYTATVWVNGERVGSHTGGFTPFSYDITDALKADGNELLVRVDDATGGYQIHGKQKRRNDGIWYTRVTGIWQTVWLEHVNPRSINDIDYACDIGAGTLTVKPKLIGEGIAGEQIKVTASIAGKVVATAKGSGAISLKIPEPKLWSPDEPNLYDLKVELLDGSGKVLDAVDAYSAMREFGKKQDANGNWRFTLNGQSVFHWGPLDQGWWPDGLLTPPSDEAMVSDIDYLKAAGFNMIRKHIKVEPRRYYAHCDKVGMLVWQDQVSQGYGPQSYPKGSNPEWTRLAPNPQDGSWPDQEHEQWVTEYKRMVDHLRDVPCIAVWVPFNEAWGQHRTMEIGKMAVEYDTTRPINIASGGNFWPVGDIADEHHYPDPAFPIDDERFDDYVKVVGEFGGHGLGFRGHLWNKNSPNWGYGSLPQGIVEWKQRYERSIEMLIGLRKRGISAGVYTQTTDVEVEINGLRTYDRINKIEPEWLLPISERLLNISDAVQIIVVVPTSEEVGQVARYTTVVPAEGWEKPDFDDSSWKRGKGGFGTTVGPTSRVGTDWSGPDIWLRREVEVTKMPEGQLILRMFHDENAEVFINGEKLISVTGFTTDYVEFPISQKGLLKLGTNVIAVHCHQTGGGQFIDFGIVEEIAR